MVHSQPIVGSPSPAPTSAVGLSAPLVWVGEAQTASFAQRLAACPQARNAVVTLHGDLGMGKTTLVRHLLRALGVTGRVKSPTYAVVEPHEVPGPEGTLHIWHFDFYRFDDPREWEDAGFRDLFASPGLKLVEWPQKVGSQLPVADLAIHLQPLDETSRRVRVHAHTLHGAAWLGAWAAQPVPRTEASA